MTFLDHALRTAEIFPVFSLKAGAKNPPPKNWRENATRDPETIRGWWRRRPNRNIGIRMGGGFLAIDVDAGKGGGATLATLELEGKQLPPTWRQRTPGGGFHLVYWTEGYCPTTVEKLGPGVDTRGENGYIAGPGSCIDDRGEYVLDDGRYPVLAPDWLVAWCDRRRPKEREPRVPEQEERPDGAIHWAMEYLAQAAPAVSGESGDDHTYVVACHLRDLGLTQGDAVELMATDWNPRCEPPWSLDELRLKVSNAFRYARGVPGEASPENEFEPVIPAPAPESPIERLNREYALVTAGGGVHVIWEADKRRIEHLSVSAWKIRCAPYKKWTDKWLQSKDRREYDGIGFYPDPSQCPERIYNTWRGFTVRPEEVTTPRAVEAVNDWFTHARENVCGGDLEQYRRLVGFFAHMIQKPQEKPRVALVLKGEKGVGKNVLVESVGHLLGNHFTLAASRRYLTGQFNSHLEGCLMVALDEAYWAGDKEAEATLKDLVTGATHHIERKGAEPYKIANHTRVIIIGNESWLVPASHDERRFDVFSVGGGRKQDAAFFCRMLEGMKEFGGYELLLQRLSDPAWLEGLDLNTPLRTAGLLEQKHQSLQPFEQWWFASIEEGRLLHFESEEWPKQVEKEMFRQAFRRYCRERNIRQRPPSDQELGQRLKKLTPSLVSTQIRKDKGHVGVYRFSPIEVVRGEWDTFLGHDHDFSASAEVL